MHRHVAPTPRSIERMPRGSLFWPPAADATWPSLPRDRTRHRPSRAGAGPRGASRATLPCTSAGRSPLWPPGRRRRLPGAAGGRSGLAAADGGLLRRLRRRRSHRPVMSPAPTPLFIAVFIDDTDHREPASFAGNALYFAGRRRRTNMKRAPAFLDVSSRKVRRNASNGLRR